MASKRDQLSFCWIFFFFKILEVEPLERGREVQLGGLGRRDVEIHQVGSWDKGGAGGSPGALSLVNWEDGREI